MFHVMKMMT